jgi:hypothetical protein
MKLALLLLLLNPSPPIAELDKLAKSRDVEAMRSYASPELLKERPNALRFLRSGGVYGTGRFGWSAHELRLPNGSTYVVFGTKITSEDIGEQVFEWKDGKLARYVDEEDDWGYRIQHHDFQIGFRPAAKEAIITYRVSFRRRKGGEPFVLVRMSPQYRVDSATASGKKLDFRQAAGVIVLPAPDTETFTYELAYTAVVDLPEYAGSINAGEALLTNDYWYPMIARKPATFTAAVRAPGNWTVITQGEKTGDELLGNQRLVRYKMDLPVVYFSLSAGPFRTRTDTVQGLKTHTFTTELTDAQMRVQNEVAAGVVQFYSKTFSPYPFSSWGSLISPIYGGGALEAYSFATYGSGWLPDEDGHEPAHTWWGGVIPNSYLRSLWNESFAVWSEGLFRRESDLGNRSERRLAFVSDPYPSGAYNAAPLLRSGADLGPAASELGYGKGAKVLQMLELELGTERMIETCREWIRSHPKGENGEWEDYEKAANRAAKTDLAWFFDQWLRRPGWIDVSMDEVRWASGKVLAKPAFKGQPYRFTCEVMLQYPDGKREFKRVQVNATGEIAIPAAAKPALVSFDPWRRLLRRYERDETPIELQSALARMSRYTDPSTPDWLQGFADRKKITILPADLENVFIVGSPERLGAMAPLCEKVGFKVRGDKLTYDGTTIDLKQGSALAVVDLGGGKLCAIGLGKTALEPRFGRARLAVTDGYGRFLRGKTEPKTSGFLTYRL